MPLIKVNMRCKYHDKDKDEEMTMYVPCLLNTDNINTVIPSGIEGVLQVGCVGQPGTNMIKADMDDILKLKPALKVVKGKKK